MPVSAIFFVLNPQAPAYDGKLVQETGDSVTLYRFCYTIKAVRLAIV
jgi:hypothetical protein